MQQTEKKEICFIAPPRASTENSSLHNETFEGKRVFTSKFPLQLCIGCCAAVKNFADIQQSFFASQLEFSQRKHSELEEGQDTTNPQHHEVSNVTMSETATSAPRSRSRSRKRKENTDSENPAKLVKKNLAKLKDLELNNSNNNNNPFSTLPPSFFSELPSVLQMELPSGTDVETLRLYSEFHCGGNYFGSNNNSSMQNGQSNAENTSIIKKLELNQVDNWGTEREKSTSLKELWANTALMRNPLKRAENELKNSNNKNNNNKSKNGNNNKNPVLEFARDDEVVEHGNLSPFVVPDRNPASLLSSCLQHSEKIHSGSEEIDPAGTMNATAASRLSSLSSSHQDQKLSSSRNAQPSTFNNGNMSIGNRVLPQWEQKWVQENFLSLDSPSCCAKAAKIAALAEYLGCMHLVQLCAVVIAARLCERPNANVDHMQWCLMGRSSGVL